MPANRECVFAATSHTHTHKQFTWPCMSEWVATWLDQWSRHSAETIFIVCLARVGPESKGSSTRRMSFM